MKPERWAQIPAVNWLGHYAKYLLLGIFASIVVLVCLPEALLQQMKSMFIVLLVPELLVIGASQLHGRHLCIRCMDETPLDPQQQVTRYKPVLKAFHVLFSKYGFIGFLVIAGIMGVRILANSGPEINVVVMFICIALTGLIAAVHRRLEPWCPYCHGRGRDDGPDPEPEPDDPEDHEPTQTPESYHV